MFSKMAINSEALKVGTVVITNEKLKVKNEKR
jgi:hypothetical protein